MRWDATREAGRPGHAFSVPRSRGTCFGAPRSPHQHRRGAYNVWQPRMGPAPAHANRLPTLTVAFRHYNNGCGRRVVVVSAGAGPIRGRHAGRSPTPVLTARRTCATGVSPRAWAGERRRRRRHAAPTGPKDTQCEESRRSREWQPGIRGARCRWRRLVIKR